MTLAKKGLDGLIEELRSSRADLVIRPSDFAGSTRGARFYPLLYLLTRTGKARDLAAGGLELSAHMLGRLSSLQVHHIFPRAQLRASGYSKAQINAIANFCFLTQEANLEILDMPPEEYFNDAETKISGALESQWIPTDPSLRTLGKYLDFLAARREKLATAANETLDALLAASAPATEVSAELANPVVVAFPGSDTDSGAPTSTSQRVAELVVNYSLAQPELVEVVVDRETGRELGMADFLWSDGLQGGYDEPTVLVLDGESTEIEMMVQGGYRVLTSLDSLETLLERRSAEIVGT